MLLIKRINKTADPYLINLKDQFRPGLFNKFKKKDKQNAFNAFLDAIKENNVKLLEGHLDALTSGDLWKKVVRVHTDQLPSRIREAIANHINNKAHKQHGLRPGKRH